MLLLAGGSDFEVLGLGALGLAAATGAFAFAIALSVRGRSSDPDERRRLLVMGLAAIFGLPGAAVLAIAIVLAVILDGM